MNVICFDVIGTLVDWKGTIKEFLKDTPLDADAIAYEWVKYYASGYFKNEVQLIDKGLALILKNKIRDYLSGEKCWEFTELWTHFQPYADTIKSMKILREKYTLVALTNVTTEVAVELSKNMELPFDFIFSAEIAGKKKPAPEVYQQVCRYLRTHPSQVLMVAAHKFDLEAAQKQGMKTCYLERHDDNDDGEYKFDYNVNSLGELIDELGKCK